MILAGPKGQEHRFQYRAAGVGLSAGVEKIPRIGPLDVSRIDPKNMSEHGSGNIAPESFWNHGAVWILDGFDGRDLAPHDFGGWCIIFDGGAGLILGYSGNVILAGLSPLGIAALAGYPTGLMFGAAVSPKAAILSRGWNVGVQASAGATAQIGYLWYHGR